MSKIIIEERVYHIHPVYDLYAVDCDGNIINITKKVPIKSRKTHDGYRQLQCRVRKHGQSGFKECKVHQFVWQSFNGVIPKGLEIDHINNIRDDNRLCNLQLLTHQNNCKKAMKNRDRSFFAQISKNPRCVKATNQNTNEITYFKSMYSVKQHLDINANSVQAVCEGLYGCKSRISKKDGCSYTFEYVREDMTYQLTVKNQQIYDQKCLMKIEKSVTQNM